MRGVHPFGGRHLLAGLAILSWLSGAALPVVLCDSGEGHLAYELAFEVCCSREAGAGPSMAPALTARENCAGCSDRAPTVLGTLTRPSAMPRPAACGPAGIPAVPPGLAACEAGDLCAPCIRFASPPGALARARIPLLC